MLYLIDVLTYNTSIFLHELFKEARGTNLPASSLHSSTLSSLLTSFFGALQTWPSLPNPTYFSLTCSATSILCSWRVLFWIEWDLMSPDKSLVHEKLHASISGEVVMRQRKLFLQQSAQNKNLSSRFISPKSPSLSLSLSFSLSLVNSPHFWHLSTAIYFKLWPAFVICCIMHPEAAFYLSPCHHSLLHF